MIQKTDKARLIDRRSFPAPGDAILCAPDEVAVVTKSGVVHVVHGKGLHPILEPGLDVAIVRTTVVEGLRGGGTISSARDEQSGVEITVRVMFEAKARVVDVPLFVTSLAEFDNDFDTRRAVAARVFEAVKRALTAGSLLTWVGSPSSLEPRVVEVGAADLKSIGVELLGLAAFTLNVSDDDLAKLRDAAALPRTGETPIAVAPPSAARIAPPAPPSSSQRLAAVNVNVPPPSQRTPLGIGSRVRVPWSDGRAYSGTIRQFYNGYFEVAWDGSQATAWLLPHQIQPD